MCLASVGQVFEQVANTTAEKPAELIDCRQIDSRRSFTVERRYRAAIEPGLTRNVHDG